MMALATFTLPIGRGFSSKEVCDVVPWIELLTSLPDVAGNLHT